MKRIASALIVVAAILLLPAVVQAIPAAPPAQAPVAQEASMPATVWVKLLNVRRAPRITSSSKGKLTKGEVVTLIGRTSDGAWVEAITRFGIGWIDKGWLTYNGFVSNLPIVPVLPPFVITTNGTEGSNIRLGPDDKYPVAFRLRPGTEADIIGIYDRPRWYQIILQDNRIGWVHQSGVQITGDLSNIPFTDAPPVAIVNTYLLKVHVAPSFNSPVIGDIFMQSAFVIIGRDFRGNFWQIRGQFGTGWVSSAFVTTVGNLGQVPLTDGTVTRPILR